MRYATILLAQFLLLGCVPATTRVVAVDSRPSIAITGAPAASSLFVDGLKMGDANAYNGAPVVLTVEPGTHDVEIRSDGGAVIYAERIFVESELKVINVH